MSLSDLCTTYVPSAKLKDETERNIIEFAEAPWGLGLGSSPELPPLYPVQKFILKCYYNIPLDNQDRRIVINDKFNEKELFRFTEIEYLKFLQDENRINIKEVTGDPKDTRPNLALVIGRRGAKSSSIALITCYETYKLLKKHCPQQYYRLMPDQEIRVSCIATNQEQAGELFRMITGHLERSEYFKKYRNKPTLSYMQLNTERDLDLYRGQRPSLRIVASPCSGRGLRGHNNIIVVLDEIAHFFEEDASPDRSDATIYQAASPSIAKFSGPDGSMHGKVMAISSPVARTGMLFDLYQRSLDPDCRDLLMINAPTWEIDHRMNPQYLRSQYSMSPSVYDREYGAKFSDKVTAWIENPELLRMNVVPGLRLKERSYERVPHFMGIDVGLKGDGTAICIGHVVKKSWTSGPRDFIEVDCVDVRYAEQEGKDYFTPDEIGDWIVSYNQKFLIAKGMLDQYMGLAIVPILNARGMKNVETIQMTRELNSQIYQNVMSKMLDSSLRIPECTEREVDGKRTKDIPLVMELLSLDSTIYSKFLISVAAPDIKGRHDDMSDAFARMVYLASDYMAKGGGSSLQNTTVGSKAGFSYKKYYLHQRATSGYTRRPSTAIQMDLSRQRQSTFSSLGSGSRSRGLGRF